MLKITKLYKSLLNFFIILITLLINSNLCALCNELSSNNDIVIRVGVLENTPTFSVSCPNGLSILDASNKKIESTKNYIEISCFKNEIYFEKHILTPPIKIESLNGVISVNYKPYRGYLIVKKSKDKMNVINVLHIEDYLKGVLPNEIGHKWNTEALKTQAVVSRTYAIKNLNKHDNNCNKDNSQGFDVCSTTHCQIYNGIKNEANTCNNAILETQAEVLTYNKNLAQTVFHSSCGGHTENPKYVWNFESITPNYLKGVKCNYCSNNTNYVEWKSSIDEAVIRKKLLNNKNIKIKSIKIKEKTPIGSAKEIEILCSDGKKKLIKAYKFRVYVGESLIKSSNINSIKTDGNKFYFKGKGYGHGIGLCQYGAKNMAENGKTYKQILNHYYPGTEIKKYNY